MSGPAPAGGFFPLVYEELRRLAAWKIKSEGPGHTLDATGLVHEAYLKLGGRGFADRSDFFRAAAVAMQRILVSHARAKRAGKRGGSARKFPIDEGDRFVIPDPDTLLDVAGAVNHLAAEDPGAADVARLRLFVGLSVEEAAEVLGLSRASAFREWAYARSWLTEALGAGPAGAPADAPG